MSLGLLGPGHIPLHCRDGRQDRGKCLPTFLAGHIERGYDRKIRLSNAERASNCKKKKKSVDGKEAKVRIANECEKEEGGMLVLVTGNGITIHVP